MNDSQRHQKMKDILEFIKERRTMGISRERIYECFEMTTSVVDDLIKELVKIGIVHCPYEPRIGLGGEVRFKVGYNESLQVLKKHFGGIQAEKRKNRNIKIRANIEFGIKVVGFLIGIAHAVQKFISTDLKIQTLESRILSLEDALTEQESSEMDSLRNSN